MPVGSSGGAEAVVVGMSVQVTHDDVIGDVAGCGREVAALPRALSPVAFADVLEFLLDFARRMPLAVGSGVFAVVGRASASRSASTALICSSSN